MTLARRFRVGYDRFHKIATVGFVAMIRRTLIASAVFAASALATSSAMAVCVLTEDDLHQKVVVASRAVMPDASDSRAQDNSKTADPAAPGDSSSTNGSK